MIERLYHKQADVIEYIDNLYENSVITTLILTLQNIAPEVTSDLLKIEPIYCNACRKAELIGLELPFNVKMSNWPHVEEFKKLKEALLDWATKFHLISEKNIIFVKLALLALETYVNSKEYFDKESEWKNFGGYLFLGLALDALCIHSLSSNYSNEKTQHMLEPPRRFIFEPDIGKWEPTIETWQEYEKRTDEEYKKYKESYKKSIENIYKQNGYEAGREKRNDKHFEWFVLYQVKGWELAKVADYIADNSGKVIGEDTIYKAVKDIAELVGLPLREGYTKSKQNIT